MSFLKSPHLLRRALVADAVFSGVSTLVLILAAGLLAGPLGLPEAFLRVIGLIFIPFVVLVTWTARREPTPRNAAWTVAGANAIWVVASIAVLLGGWLEPTGLGIAFIIVQAVIVGLLAELQTIGLWRSTATATA